MDEEELVRYLKRFNIQRRGTSQNRNQNVEIINNPRPEQNPRRINQNDVRNNRSNNTNENNRNVEIINNPRLEQNSRRINHNFVRKNRPNNTNENKNLNRKPNQQNKINPNAKGGNQRGRHNANLNRPKKMDWFTMEPQPSTSRSNTNNIPPLIPPPRNEYGGSYVQNHDNNQQTNDTNQRDLPPQNDTKEIKPNRKNAHNRPDYIGFKRLEDMCKMECEKLVPILSLEEVGFDKLLKRDNSTSQDVYILILKLIRKISESPFTQHTGHLLSMFCQREFIDQLLKYVQDITIQSVNEKRKNRYFWEDTDEFWDNIVVIFEMILKMIPTTACDVLPKIVKAVALAIRNFEDEQGILVSNNIKTRFEEFQVNLTISIEERERKIKQIAADDDDDDIEPPDDFRNLSLYPLVGELLTKEKAFIRPNIIDRKYKSIDHYLDVQFRLLREDFIAPLRNGILDFISNMNTKDKKRIYDVRIYQKVQFLHSKSINDKIIKVVKFIQNPEKSRMRFERRLMFGSLLCFTDDYFKTIIFGTVNDRKMDDLKKGEVGVELINEDIKFGKDYVMIECSVYFEPYYHVLKALQEMDENIFPFPEYIIDLTTDVKPPKYLNIESILRYSGRRFYPLDKSTWLSSEDLKFDESQCRAFNAALSNEFCVIQGPPGTGKTFIGLKITDVLLSNRLFKGPILVICFTNHALDQFLEGMLTFTQQICRVGGQSKNDKLKPFNIKELRFKQRRSGLTGAALLHKRDELKNIMSKIKSVQTEIEFILSYSSILNFQIFDIPEIFYELSKDFMLNWLLGGFNKFQIDEMNTLNENMENLIEDDDDIEDDIFLDCEEIENERRINDFDLDINIKGFISSSSFNQLTNLDSLKKDCDELNTQLEKINSQPENEYALYNEKQELIDLLEIANNKYQYLEYRLNQRKNGEHPKPPVNVNYNQLDHINNLTHNQRWGLYWKWLDEHYKSLSNKMNQFENDYRKAFREYEEINSIEDINLMKNLKVIGMTTTGAARFQTLLRALKCSVVIVEEAAEVLETHIIVSLTRDCQHLILIGDHKQLRPTTAVYHLAKKYNLEISLFERMVQNGVHCHTLEVQHRMRPEIASLIVPTIYPKLDNHKNVHQYPPVLGTLTNLFFITHNIEEELVSDSSSRMNRYEAEFIINFARHLLLQGYEPDDITILTTYSGQMFQLWKERKKYSNLNSVRITVVDNFQGEESKIILLSLVRSNAEGNIGFLRIDNRVNVALSRAKHGLFIIGNMDILIKNNDVWPKIKDTLEKLNCIDTKLTLKCQNHPDQLTNINNPKDFLKISEGGCTLPCQKSLNCGHICKSLCHIIDREHKEYSCKERCIKIICDRNHQCPDYCSAPCSPCKMPIRTELECGHTHILPCYLDPELFDCPTLLSVVLECEHRVNKPCYIDIKKFACTHLCDIRMDCGHSCTQKCHIKNDPDHLKVKCYKPCEKIKRDCSTNTHKCQLRCYEECSLCEELVKKTRTVCIHTHTIKCCENVDEIICEKRCDKVMPCGHKCKMKCSDSCGNCKEKVEKTYDLCGHKCKVRCSEKPDRKYCTKKCPLSLPCGHKCQAKCNQNCTRQCMELVDYPFKAACGHQIKIPCYKRDNITSTNTYDLLQYCTEPCNTLLKCEHKCGGNCGKCAQGRIHFSCQEECGKIMVCGHACEIPCRDACLPCTKKCNYQCVHSKCPKKCGTPCVICQENCTKRCEHQMCRKKCGEKCNIDPCEEPCKKPLKCGHECIGFCGDPCPPVCRVCNPDDDTFETFFGDEDEPDARFVYLVDCGHCIEANAIKKWMIEGNNNEINVKSCPKCKTLILKTQRFSDFIKAAYRDIIDVKLKAFGKPKDNEDIQKNLIQRVQVFRTKILYIKSEMFRNVIDTLTNDLNLIKKEKKSTLSIIELNTFEIQINMIEKLLKIYEKCISQSDKIKCIAHVDFLLQILSQLKNRVTPQVVEDFDLEFLRLERLIEIFKLESIPSFKVAIANDKTKELYLIISNILKSIKKYSIQQDKALVPLIERFGKSVHTTFVITREEKAMIVKAMGMAQGHWYKCPNGHPYCITECGGAMQISKCNECGARIGGTNHRLLDDNRHDGSMDGSSHAAWSDAANMQNYRFD